MKKIFVTCAILALYGCGGGDTSSVPNIEPISGNTFGTQIEGQYYVDQSENFPDLRPYYEKMCGNKTMVGDFVVADLDNDGFNDIIVRLWCDLNGWNPSLMGTPYTGEIKNTLVIIKQKPNQTFYIANQEYFGKDIISLDGGGGTGSNAVGDFNGDGKIDIVFANHKEDGRSPLIYQDGTSNFSSYGQVLMSTQNGFAIQTLPGYGINTVVSVIKNSNNKDDIIIGGRQLSYINNNWITTNSLPWSDQSSIGYKIDNSTYLFTRIDDNSKFGVMLSKETSNGYEVVSRFILGDMSYINFYFPNGGYSRQQVSKIKDEYWFWSAFGSSCYRNTIGNITTIYTVLEGIRLKEYSEEKLYVYGVDNNYDLTGKILINNYDYVGKVLKVTLTDNVITAIDFDAIDITYPKDIQCIDTNKDGKIDYFVNRWLDNTYNPLNTTTNPYVFLNSGTNYNKVSDEKFPSTSTLYYGQVTHLADINKDGLLDLIYLPGGFKDNSYNGPIKIKLYIATMPLN